MSREYHRKSWSAEELAMLARLCAIGPDWRSIGKELSRTPEACRRKAVMSGIIPQPDGKRQTKKHRLYSACVCS